MPSLSISRRVCASSFRTLSRFSPPNSLTYSVATLIAIGDQVNLILNFFLRKNIAIAKQRVWEQTVASRGKGPSFWKAYVEEWDRPPVVVKPGWGAWLSGSTAQFVIRRGEHSQSLNFLPDPFFRRSAFVSIPDLPLHRYLRICVPQGARNRHLSA